MPTGLKRTIADVLEHDVNFLKEQSVLDYSVLIGIHDRQSKEAGIQNKGVRLLQGIVKQKDLSKIASRKSSLKNQDLTVQKTFAGDALKPLCEDLEMSPADLQGNREADVTRLMNSSNFMPSRLSSCMSDPYEESEYEFSLSGEFFEDEDFPIWGTFLECCGVHVNGTT